MVCKIPLKDGTGGKDDGEDPDRHQRLPAGPKRPLRRRPSARPLHHRHAGPLVRMGLRLSGVEYGLPVPREAMRLVGDPENPRLVTIRSRVDHTDGMLAWAERRLKTLAALDLCGFIFKGRSPSSGMAAVKVYGRDRNGREKGGGDLRRGVHETFSAASRRGGRPPERSAPPGELHRADLRLPADGGSSKDGTAA